MINRHDSAPTNADMPASQTFKLPQFSNVDSRRLSFLYSRDGKLLEPMPHDPMTGIPLSYTPRRELPPPSSKQSNSGRIADWEHLVPRAEVALAQNNPVLDSDLGRAALVSARIQWVSYDDHHNKKNYHYRGPVHPQNADSMTLFLLMAEAGYVPPEAIDFSDDSPKKITLNKVDRDFLRDSGQIRMACSGIVRAWLRRQIIEQNTDNIIKDRWLEFLGTHDIAKKINLAHMLAAKLVEEAVGPIDEAYLEAHKDGLLPEHLPRHPREFLKRELFAVAAHGSVICAMNERFGKEKRRLYPELYQEATVAA